MQKIISAIISFLTLLLPVIQKSEMPEFSVQLPVIMYHHISENTSLLNDYVITPTQFENDIKYLYDHGYNSVRISDIRNGNIPENPVLITFDDGFLSTYTYALPVLKKYNMTAVCAVIGSVMTEFTLNPDTSSDCAYLSTDVVRQMLESETFEIACHTYDMHKLTDRKGCAKTNSESDEEYRSILTEDLSDFNKLYSQSLGAATDIIAFPYGEYSSQTVQIAKSMGYSVMLTCEEKINTVNIFDDCIILGRFNRPHGKTSEEFFDNILNKKTSGIQK